MQALTHLCLLAVLNFAVGLSSQRPELTRCPGTNVSAIQIDSVTVRNAKLGKTAQVTAKIHVDQTTGRQPVLQVSFSTPKGRTLKCARAIVPTKLKLCDGTTRKEKKLNSKWDNKCPIEAGDYTVRLSFYLPGINFAQMCLRDGHLVATLKIQDGGKTLDCVSYPITVDLNRPELGQ